MSFIGAVGELVFLAGFALVEIVICIESTMTTMPDLHWHLRQVGDMSSIHVMSSCVSAGFTVANRVMRAATRLPAVRPTICVSMSMLQWESSSSKLPFPCAFDILLVTFLLRHSFPVLFLSFLCLCPSILCPLFVGLCQSSSPFRFAKVASSWRGSRYKRASHRGRGCAAVPTVKSSSMP